MSNINENTRVLSESKGYFTEVRPVPEDGFIMAGIGTAQHSTFMALSPTQARQIGNALLRYAGIVEIIQGEK